MRPWPAPKRKRKSGRIAQDVCCISGDVGRLRVLDNDKHAVGRRLLGRHIMPEAAPPTGCLDDPSGCLDDTDAPNLAKCP
jgi:hypothetical protein